MNTLVLLTAFLAVTASIAYACATPTEAEKDVDIQDIEAFLQTAMEEFSEIESDNVDDDEDSDEDVMIENYMNNNEDDVEEAVLENHEASDEALSESLVDDKGDDEGDDERDEAEIEKHVDDNGDEIAEIEIFKKAKKALCKFANKIKKICGKEDEVQNEIETLLKEETANVQSHAEIQGFIQNLINKIKALIKKGKKKVCKVAKIVSAICGIKQEEVTAVQQLIQMMQE